MQHKQWMILIALVIACTAPAPPPPNQGNVTTREADIRGTVTKVEGNQIRVEATPDEFRGAKAVVTLSGATTIRTKSGGTVSSGSIRKGQVVRVWFTGAVAQSYPIQAEAAEVIVESAPQN
jgi:hypothetical protein